MSIRTWRAVALATTLSLVSVGMPTAAAIAADVPAADVSSTPAPTAVPEPTETPTPASEPTETPTTEQTPTPEVSPSAAPVETVKLTGRFVQIADAEPFGHEHGVDEGHGEPVLFAVAGQGMLRVDASSVPEAATDAARATVTLEVPAGVDLPTDADARFDALAAASVDAPLEAVSGAPARQTAAQISQGLNSPATHQVFSVLVSPSKKPIASNQTAARATAAVAYADSYWNQQSGGSVRFTSAAVIPWYSSSYSCATIDGSYALWEQAAAKAASRGYQMLPNQHLVLFLPYTANCGGAIGLGSIGYSVNEGGWVWVLGTTQSGANADPGAKMERATLAHELGHNMSLGHSDWLDCSATNPNYSLDFAHAGDPGGTSVGGCLVKDYGDVVDVMGYGFLGYSGGALSSIHGIRSGIWPSSAWATAPSGSTTYTLNSVSSNSGLRAVVVGDTDGNNYVVEYRTFTDEDAPYSLFGCDQSQWDGYICVANDDAVRVLRLDHDDDSNLQAPPGVDSLVLGAQTGFTDFVDRAEGATWWSRGLNTGVRVVVDSVDGSTATITVTRGSVGAPVNGPVRIENSVPQVDPAINYVGDTLSVFLGDTWVADEYLYQWYRDGSPIGGATGAHYVLTPADLGANIRAGVIGRTPGQTDTAERLSATLSVDEPSPIAYAGDGSIDVEVGSSGLDAVVADWPASTTFAYQWFRTTSTGSTGTAIPGATGATYVPTASDRGVLLRVRVTATVPGYGPATVRLSTALGYTLNATGTLGVSGTAKVGEELTVADARTFSTPASGAVTPDGFSYQWLRSGVVIPGATASTYTLVAADLAKTLSVRVTATGIGMTPLTATSTSSAKIAIGVLSGTRDLPTITGSPTFLLTAVPTPGAIDTPGVTLAYQWYRAGVAITGATKSTFPSTAADYNKAITVRVTYAKTAFTSVALVSSPANFSLVPVGTAKIVGERRVGGSLGVQLPLYRDASTDSVLPTVDLDALEYQWLRNGTAIPGATSDTYEPVTADAGKAISLRVTAREATLLPSITTTAATAALGTTLLDGYPYPDVATVGLDPSTTELKTVLRVTDTGVTGPLPVTTSYQWLRNGVPIAGATRSTYALSSLDLGRSISVRVTSTKPAAGGVSYTPVVLFSTPRNYSITTPAASLTVPTLRVGQVLVPTDTVYTTVDGPLDPSEVIRTYQWFRDGRAIVGGNAPTYTLAYADLGKKMSVRITVRRTGGGFLPLVVMQYTSPRTATVKTGIMSDSSTILITPTAPGVVQATFTPSITPSTAMASYQWLRNGVPIVGATAATYRLTSADRLRSLAFRVTFRQIGYSTLATTSAPAPTAVTAPSMPAITSSGGFTAGETLSVSLPIYSAAGGPGVTPTPVTPTLGYQWYRNGGAIGLATGETYVLGPQDVGKQITVRVTAAANGVLTMAHTSPATPTISPAP